MTPPQTELPRTIEPCEHMEHWVNELADGSLKGPARLYTKFHVVTCSKCRTALEALEAVHNQLHGLDDAPSAGEACMLTPDRREALDTALTDVEQQVKSSPSGV